MLTVLLGQTPLSACLGFPMHLAWHEDEGLNPRHRAQASPPPQSQGGGACDPVLVDEIQADVCCVEGLEKPCWKRGHSDLPASSSLLLPGMLMPGWDCSL